MYWEGVLLPVTKIPIKNIPFPFRIRKLFYLDIKVIITEQSSSETLPVFNIKPSDLPDFIVTETIG